MKHKRSAAAAVVVALLGVLLAGSGARAATPGCDTVSPAGACGSWQTVTGLDLDVLGQSRAASTPLIAWTPARTDPAEDFEEIQIPPSTPSSYPSFGASPAEAFALEYAPGGVASDMCVSVISATAGQPAELRPCEQLPGEYNPYQAFQAWMAACDGTCVTLRNVIGSVTEGGTTLYLTDPRSGIGRKGHRVPVVSEPPASGGPSGGQLWQTAG
jgi:hypothetical protein